MALTSPNKCAEPGTPAKTICDYRKRLKDELAASESIQFASTSKIAGWKTARGYQLCTLAETEKTLDYYRDLDNYELYDIQQSIVILVTNVATFITWDGDLTKSIKDASKMLNDLKTKMLEANNAACAMRNCLQSIIGFGDNEVPPKLQAVTDLAKKLSENSQKAAEAMVTIAGIHTFADLQPLKQFVQELTTVFKDLKTVTDGCIKAADGDLKAAQAELLKVIDGLNTEMFVSAGAQSAINGLKEALLFICGWDCRPIGCLEEICKKITSAEQSDPAAEQQTSKYRKDQA